MLVKTRLENSQQRPNPDQNCGKGQSEKRPRFPDWNEARRDVPAEIRVIHKSSIRINRFRRVEKHFAPSADCGSFS